MSTQPKPEPDSQDFWVNGIVSHRNFQPYVQLSNTKGMIAQLTLSETRQIAEDMLNMAARTEMDAMMFRFLVEECGSEPEHAGGMMQQFRDYRAEYDRAQAERPPSQEGGLPPRL